MDYDAVFPQILDRIAAGDSIGNVLKELGIVHPSTFYLWVDQSSIRAQAYGRAQTAKAEGLADEIVQIADTEQDSNKARNRISARQWYASKVIPRKYGDRLDVQITERVDLGGTLLEARKRTVLRPMCDPAQELEAQDADYVMLDSPRTTDTQSVDAPKPPHNPFD